MHGGEHGYRRNTTDCYLRPLSQLRTRDPQSRAIGDSASGRMRMRSEGDRRTAQGRSDDSAPPGTGAATRRLDRFCVDTPFSRLRPGTAANYCCLIRKDSARIDTHEDVREDVAVVLYRERRGRGRLRRWGIGAT